MTTFPLAQGQPKRHVGMLQNTPDKARVIVLFHQLPDDPATALVMKVDSLSNPERDQIFTHVDTEAGQSSKEFGEYLHRMGVLQHYHNKNQQSTSKFIIKVSVDEVLMSPLPSQQIGLRELLEKMGRLQPLPSEPTALETNQSDANPLREKLDDEQTKRSENEKIARNILFEANLLQIEVNKKLEQAYSICPSLRPQAQGTDASKATKTAASTPRKKTRGEVKKEVKAKKTTKRSSK